MVWSEACNSTLPDCLSPTNRDPWERDYAAIVPRFSGGLSAISSASIIYVILRSEKGLSSIYHRIMFGMSIADILGSTAMALTSLPMPSYMPKEIEFGYHWAGTRLGNTYTCNTQGFFASFGTVVMFFYTATLCIFYACSIAFKMRERNIRKYVEPIIHALPVLVGLSYAVPPLILEMYNPGITSYAWCAPLPYPDECVYQGIKCVRGSADAMNFVMTMLRCLIVSVFSIIIVSMVLIVWRVTSTERLLHKVTLAIYSKMDNCANLEGVLRRHSFTKAVVYQASAYIFALLLGLLLPLIRTMNVVSATDESERGWDKIVAMDKGILVLLPVQGFFNLAIFVSHKVYNYRRACNGSISICGVLRAGTHEPVYISRISIVKRELSGNDDGNAKDCTYQKPMGDFYDFDVVEDDNEEEALQFRISLFQQNQLEQDHDTSIQSDTQNDIAFQEQPSVVTDSTIDLDPIEQMCINSSKPLSPKISISSDGDVDISCYDDLNHSRSFDVLSFISGGGAKQKPQRKYYYMSNP